MFANNAYAKVWEVKPSDNGKSKQVRLSTSRKKEDGSYEQDFSGFVRFVGKANELDIKADDRVQLLSVGVTNNYVKEKSTTYTNYTCFDAKIAENNGNSGTSGSTGTPNSSSPASDGFMNIPDGIDDELPFN